ncbi:MAG: glutamate--cysteine ligase [Bdellovibrionaceae bacterium]|nr:glutamate--cysteine ligase [Pseudobdellovibrionaceae bacterium]
MTGTEKVGGVALVQKIIHEAINSRRKEVIDWFVRESRGLPHPIYSSYDIRDAGYKIAIVDANIYPAGFNNICPTDKEAAVTIFKNYIRKKYGPQIQRILLLTEEHTQNPFYWENIGAIQDLMSAAGFQVRLAFPTNLAEPISIQSATGRKFLVGSGNGTSSWFLDFSPDLIISNNDFSDPHEDWARSVSVPINPPRELGWFQRSKERNFRHYNRLVTDFCNLIGVDPFLLTVRTEAFPNFDTESAESRSLLAERVDALIGEIRERYRSHNVVHEPFVFIKNNAGTYGLAVTPVKSGRDVMSWSYKSRKKMKAAKGGRDVEEVIIQEGIPSIVKSDGASAEPVIYMIGCELAGGFLRAHADKTDSESLNSPGAVYKRLCVADLAIDPVQFPNENVYGWIAKVGLLAIAHEAREMRVEFKDYLSESCRF